MQTKEQRIAELEARVDALEGQHGVTAAAQAYDNAIAGGASEKDAKTAAAEIKADAREAAKRKK